MAALIRLPYLSKTNNMKKSVFFAVLAAFMLLSVSASAQFTQSKGSSIKGGSKDVFNTADVTYSPMTLVTDFGLQLKTNLNAVSVNWSQYRNITESTSIYLQYGAGLQMAWGDFEPILDGAKVTALLVKVPVNVVYKFEIPNTKLTLLPFAGLNLQGYLLGKGKSTYYDAEGEKITTPFSIFSKEDMGGDRFRRVVLGWQIGAKLMYDRYFFGLAYDGPVTKLYNKDGLNVKASQVNISLGITF